MNKNGLRSRDLFFSFLLFILFCMVTSPTFADADDYIWTNLTIKDGEDYPTGYSNSNQSLNTVTTGANCKQLCADDSNCIAFWFSNGTRHATDSHGNIHDKPYPLCLHYSRLSNPIQWESYFDNVDYTERVFEKKGALKACVDPNSFNIGGNPNTSTLEMGKAYTGIGYLLGYLNSPQDCATEIQSSGGKAWVLLYFKGLNNLITGYCFGSSTGQDSGTQFTLKKSPATAVFPTTAGVCTANENECTQTSSDSSPNKKCCARGKLYQCTKP